MNYFIGVLIFFTLLASRNIDENLGEIKHQVLVLHPGISLTDSVEQVFIEVLPSETTAHEYYMEVETVVCGDDQCKIDIVKIYLNEFGMFDRLEVPEGVHLEKAEGVHFNKDDYRKLNQILSNQDASLKNVNKYEVVGRETSDGLDGITGATIILNTNDYVQGAVWTCYTLWHWVNGGIFQKIRDITGDNKTSEELLSLLKSEEEYRQIFSIEQLDRNQIYQSRISDQLNHSIIKNSSLLKPGLRYLKGLPIDTFEEVYMQLLQSIEPNKRAECLAFLKESELPARLGFIEDITTLVCEDGGFEELNTLIGILEERPDISSSIKRQLLTLLQGDSFISARLVYWFLFEQALTVQEENELKSFHKKNAHRLN